MQVRDNRAAETPGREFPVGSFAIPGCTGLLSSRIAGTLPGAQLNDGIFELIEEAYSYRRAAKDARGNRTRG